MIRKLHTFTVLLTGEGETPEEAWENVFEGVNLSAQLDPYEVPMTYSVLEIEDEEKT